MVVHASFFLLKYLTFQMIIEMYNTCTVGRQRDNFCMLFDSDIQDNNLQVYMNMIKCSPLVLFDMPACHAWAHKQIIFDTPYKHY